MPNQDNLALKDEGLFRKVSRSIEKQIAEFYELIKKHKE